MATLCKVHARYVGHYDFTGSSRLAWACAFTAFLFLASYTAGIPADLQGRFPWKAAAGATVSAALAISALQLAIGSQLLPRFVVFAATVALIPWFVLTADLARRRTRTNNSAPRVIAVLDADQAASLSLDLARSAVPLSCLVEAVDVRNAAAEDQLAHRARAFDASTVVLSSAAMADPAIVAQAVALHARGFRIRSLSQFYEERLRKLPIAEIAQTALLFDIAELHGAYYQRAKRTLDAVVALLALPVLMVVAPIVWLANRIGDGGPLLFRQARIGKDGVPFTILKFRTMASGAASGEWTAEADLRITAVGRFLRRVHLDELPQVINVLRGDLSIVGPRPEQPHYVEALRGAVPFYDTRHLVRPGLTGWAQVNFGYGASTSDALEKLQYECFYLRRQSLAFDLRILLQTLRCIAAGRGR